MNQTTNHNLVTGYVGFLSALFPRDKGFCFLCQVPIVAKSATLLMVVVSISTGILSLSPSSVHSLSGHCTAPILAPVVTVIDPLLPNCDVILSAYLAEGFGVVSASETACGKVVDLKVPKGWWRRGGRKTYALKDRKQYAPYCTGVTKLQDIGSFFFAIVVG